MQDEILTDLAKVADLKVISRASVQPYKDATARNLREIAQQLGVAHVLEGSVQRANGKVRINAQLIDARTEVSLWAQTYDRDLADVFAIQSEIAATIAEQLQARLSPNERKAMAQAPTNDLLAYDLYVRARALDDHSNDPAAKASMLEAVTLLEEAVRRDPRFFLAYCLLCETHLDIYWGGFDHTPARRERAHAALLQAERIEPAAGEVHMQKGIYAYHGFRHYDEARAEFGIARQSLPNSSRLYVHIGAVDRRQAHWDDALKNFNHAVELDPRNFIVLEEAGLTYGGLRRTAEAQPLLERALALQPDDFFVRSVIWQFPFRNQGDIASWRAHLDAVRTQGETVAARVAVDFVDCALAAHDRTAAESALRLIPPEGVVNPRDDALWPRDWYVGLVARGFGEQEAAERAFRAARAVVAGMTNEQPDYPPGWSMLGAIDAGLGDKENAITEGERACQLLPVAKDAWDGPAYVTNLALIYCWLGETDRALDQLEVSAKIPAGVSYGELKLLPRWDALRSAPRFAQVVASLAPR